MRLLQDPRKRIEESPEPGKVWLLCDECRRFFRYERARSFAGQPHEACPFDDCHAVGLGFVIFLWDDFREPEDPRWPSSPDELEHGMRAPEMESFYEARLEARIDDLAAAFEASPERTTLLDAAPIRYVRVFLEMMADLSSDLTDGAGFSEGFAPELLDQLPVWSRTADLEEAPRMVDELRAFFRFAARTEAFDAADKWAALIEEELILRLLRHTMQTDRRLRPKTPQRPRCPSSRPRKKRKRRKRRSR